MSTHNTSAIANLAHTSSLNKLQIGHNNDIVLTRSSRDLPSSLPLLLVLLDASLALSGSQ